ncbi:MAG: pirin family protein [Sandaracinus sp.]|nr:pirin family protein [Sandaracinus sp.]MCB9619662.1 pirin family protein [Sandaracinus sp.]MCB9636411.1 pirin family protein [Sandaracinus sp.]
MIRVRRSEERGHANHGWLRSKHTFSFAGYWDPQHMGFRTLRVINEDRVAPGAGFPRHPHRDMEILSYVVEGGLEHRDTLGTGSVIRPGDVQRMSAGRGIAHSEYNASRDEPVHFLQIWIEPGELGIAPGYEQKRFEPEDKRDRLRLVASRDGRDGSITVHQDVDLYASLLSPGAKVEHSLATSRGAWVQVVRGAVKLNSELLRTGDAAAVENAERFTLEGVEDAELLVFDLA